MYDGKTTIDGFLDAAAAKQPAPGGGSIAALCGALASAMGEMVINYSLGKKNLADYQEDLGHALENFHRERLRLLELMVEDQSVYSALTAARKLPQSDDRDQQITQALLASIRTPEAIGAAAVVILEICDGVINFVNFHLLSDLAVCADLAMATVRCAVYNVHVNLADVADPPERHRIESTIGHVLSRAAALIQRISPRIWERHEQGA